MRHNAIVAGLALVVGSRAALGVHVYMMSSGNAAMDDAAVLALTSRGHTVTLGVTYYTFDGSVSLAGVDTVYLQANYDWTMGAMPAAGQQQLVAWVNGGGRLVTGEWVMYLSSSAFAGLASILPTLYSTFTNTPTTTLTQGLHNNTISPGVPASFTIPLDNIAGTESITVPKDGAHTYYTTNAGGIVVSAAPAVVGWHVGGAAGGYVYTITSSCGPNQVADANFGRLFANTMAGVSPPCEAADFNHDGDAGTDQDIEAFFACIGGHCCATCDSADFDGDGDVATDADIEAFFRVLAGGSC